jgi:hypothetical protein
VASAGGGVDSGLQVRKARPAVLGAACSAQDLAERPTLHVDLSDDLGKGDSSALTARHRAGRRRRRMPFERGCGIEDGGHDQPMIMNMKFIFK